MESCPIVYLPVEVFKQKSCSKSGFSLRSLFFQLGYCLVLIFLLLISIRIFYQNHHLFNFYIHLCKYKIFCVQHIFNLLKNYFFSLNFREFVFPFDYIFSNEIQVNSYAFVDKVIRLKCPHFVPYFSIIWASVNCFI